MVDTAIWTSVLTGAAAIGGVLVSVAADGLKDRRRIVHERAAREAERRGNLRDRRRTFELENLIAAYDGLWQLTREAAKLHVVDRRAAATEHGYGGTRLPEGVESDIAVTSQAVKTIRLILDDDVRTLALQAHSAFADVSLLGVKAKLFGRAPVGMSEGDAAFAEAADIADKALQAISDRIRTLMTEE